MKMSREEEEEACRGNGKMPLKWQNAVVMEKGYEDAVRIP
jgi:hypothetical protein